MSNTDDVVLKYQELTHTNFPYQLDKLKILRDPSATEIPLINTYNAYIAAGNTVEAVAYLNQYPSLKECIINADVLLTMYHGILAVQRFFYDNVQEKIHHIGQQKGDWLTTMSTDASDDNLHLNMYDIVRYPVDGVSQYFMVISNDIPAGILPTDTSCYMQMTIKGDKGDTGYTPVKGIDYFDGVSGLGLAPRGSWINNLEYSQYDLVSHNQFLWYCTEANIAQEPSDDSAVWYKVEIDKQIYIGTEMPDTLSEGGIWLHLQDDGHVIIKTRNTDGTFDVLYPETKASYITDEVGESLQRKIYQHYFERDDVKITMLDGDPVYTSTAALLDNPSIIVAKSILTDNSDYNGTMIEEFTVYDETGIFVMYKCKNVYTIDDENGVYTKTPEVIV